MTVKNKKPFYDVYYSYLKKLKV